MYAYVTEPGWEAVLIEDLTRRFPRAAARLAAPGFVTSEPVAASVLPFSRQLLPDARPFEGSTVSAFAGAAAALVEHAGAVQLQVFRLDDPAVRTGRVDLIQRELWKRLRRPRGADEALVQVALIDREHGLVSVVAGAARHALRRCLSPFPGGVAPVARDPDPPSRAYAKLVEAQLQLGVGIEAGDTVVDLGASPGGWTHVALARGARVTAVDRSPLRADLMAHASLTFVGGDAFRYRPDGPAPVDWVLSDVAAFPARMLELIEAWVAPRPPLARRFVLTIKFRGREDYPILDDIARRLEELGAEFILRRLAHNKNEVTAFGITSA